MQSGISPEHPPSRLRFGQFGGTESFLHWTSIFRSSAFSGYCRPAHGHTPNKPRITCGLEGLIEIENDLTFQAEFQQIVSNPCRGQGRDCLPSMGWSAFSITFCFTLFTKSIAFTPVRGSTGHGKRLLILSPPPPGFVPLAGKG